MKVFSRRLASGFTLVEMLVVLAVMAVLSGIFLGVFVRVRERGRGAACQSNLHQMGLALQQYVSDANGVYLPSSYSGVWCELLQPYLKSTQVFRCPSNAENWPQDALPNVAYRVDYFYNYPHLLIDPLSPSALKKSFSGQSEAVLPTATRLFTLFDVQ